MSAFTCPPLASVAADPTSLGLPLLRARRPTNASGSCLPGWQSTGPGPSDYAPARPYYRQAGVGADGSASLFNLSVSDAVQCPIPVSYVLVVCCRTTFNSTCVDGVCASPTPRECLPLRPLSPPRARRRNTDNCAGVGAFPSLVDGSGAMADQWLGGAPTTCHPTRPDNWTCSGLAVSRLQPALYYWQAPVLPGSFLATTCKRLPKCRVHNIFVGNGLPLQ